MKTLKPKFGFSLLELLVVISLMSILITIGLTSFSTIQRKGDDAKRKSDVKEIQNALEQYYSVCGFKYPTPGGSNPNYWFSSINCPLPAISIMPTVPLDPKVTPYFCTNCSSSVFKICPTLEAETTEFCVTNQQ